MTSELDLRIARLLAPGVVDMHFDLPLDLYDRRHAPGILETDFLPDLAAGGAGVLGVALYVENKHLPEMGLRVALDQVARLYAEVGRGDRFAICRSYAEIDGGAPGRPHRPPHHDGGGGTAGHRPRPAARLL